MPEPSLRDEAGRKLYGLRCLCIGHRNSSPAIAGRLALLGEGLLAVLLADASGDGVKVMAAPPGLAALHCTSRRARMGSNRARFGADMTISRRADAQL